MSALDRVLAWLDRRATGEVVCRNCPNYQARGSFGTCALEAPFPVNTPEGGIVGALRVRAINDWCAHHPLHFARKSEGLYYAPDAFEKKDAAGFNRAPSLAEALQFAPDAPENHEAARAMQERLTADLCNRNVNREVNSG